MDKITVDMLFGPPEVPKCDMRPQEGKEVRKIPLIEAGSWIATMEGWYLSAAPSDVFRAAAAVYYSLDAETRDALMRPSAPGEWANRVLFWKQILKARLPQRQYRIAIMTILDGYKRSIIQYREWEKAHNVSADPRRRYPTLKMTETEAQRIALLEQECQKQLSSETAMALAIELLRADANQLQAIAACLKHP